MWIESCSSISIVCPEWTNITPIIDTVVNQVREVLWSGTLSISQWDSNCFQVSINGIVYTRQTIEEVLICINN